MLLPPYYWQKQMVLGESNLKQSPPDDGHGQYVLLGAFCSLHGWQQQCACVSERENLHADVCAWGAGTLALGVLVCCAHWRLEGNSQAC